MKAPLRRQDGQTLIARSRGGLERNESTHMRPAVRKMMALISPTIHSSLPVPSIPSSVSIRLGIVGL